MKPRFKIGNGAYVGSPLLGFRAQDKDLAEIEAEMDLVRAIKELRGQWPEETLVLKVADHLNDEGRRSKRGGRLYAPTIHPYS